jgi:ElaB/YqjD/DUF883 family membrane-anchored ribosome-binding protein
MKRISDEITKEQLIADFSVVVADAEALLKATAKHGGDEIADVRAKAEQSIRTVKASMAAAPGALLERGREAAKATDGFVQENPWEAVGAAAGVGLVIGLLMGHR